MQENTPDAFAAAVAAGADWIELDVRRSADGVLVLYHDGWTPDGVAVIDRTAAELAEHGLWTLSDVLADFPAGVGLDVEVKNLPGEPDYDFDDEIVPVVAEMVAPLVGQRPLMTSSFNPITVGRLVEALPEVPCSLIHFETLAIRSAAVIALEQGAAGLSPRVGSPGLDAEGVAAVHADGLTVLVWTVNAPELARELAAAGVDALCTDDPGAILAAFAPAS
jgi:glycerophosphoryl diester phosphodiesterase